MSAATIDRYPARGQRLSSLTDSGSNPPQLSWLDKHPQGELTGPRKLHRKIVGV